jgi:ABC-2 type transport system permease protein
MNALNIAIKDLQILFKDRSALIQLLLVPLVFIILFSGALGEIGKGRVEEDTRIPLAVVDLDGGQAAQVLLAGIDAAGGVRTEIFEMEKAQSLSQDRKIDRFLTIPAGFTEGLHQDKPVILRLTNHPDADAQQTEAVRLVIDGVARDMALESQILLSLQQMGDMLASSPPEFQQAFSVERTQAQARSQFEKADTQPLVTIRQSTPASDAEKDSEEVLNMTLLAVPGAAVLFVFLTAQATASSIYEEKKFGSFRRLLASPLSKASLLAGKLIPNFITALIQMGIIFLFGTLGLRVLGLQSVSLGNDPLALLLVVGLIALCSSALGLVIAALARTEAQIGNLSTLLLWILGLLGGSLIPLFILERFLGPLPKIIPHYWAIRALESVMIRGLDLPSVTIEMLALLGFTALFFAIGLWRFEYS